MGEITVTAFGILTLLGALTLGIGLWRRSRAMMLVGALVLVALAVAWVV